MKGAGEDGTVGAGAAIANAVADALASLGVTVRALPLSQRHVRASIGDGQARSACESQRLRGS